MADRGKLAKLRRKVLLKSKRDDFQKSESWRLVRVEGGWRRSKGIDSKMRLKKKSKPASPSIGFRLMREVRGLHPSGYREVLVHNAEELEGVDPAKEAVRIAHTVGRKKRFAIMEKAKEKGLHILNPGVLHGTEASA